MESMKAAVLTAFGDAEKFEIQTVPIITPAQLPQICASVINDTTQRRQAEEALQRSEARFRAIFENSQVGIFRTRLSDGLILNANQRLANLLGFDSPEDAAPASFST
ncbi:PAS domain-containing protein [Leptolyngbya sp. FACHB-261]|uniref:PAS domain-containing protein n=1 Tax=Leptolyngbya sp. FACHB-261 TaxID=2692806 RepID=UPI0018F02056|nr:PAS domain-containing protein [Leptolyngbya sp. FACHB-261]